MPPVGVATPVLARYYDPSTGQFLSVDTDVATTLSPYGYVAGNPLNDTDPTGLGPIQDVQAAIASALASQFNSWSQQVQDQYVKLSNVLKDLQLEQRGLENDDNQLSEAEISDHIEQYEQQLANATSRLGDLANAGRGGSEAASELEGILNDASTFDPYAASGTRPPRETGPPCLVDFGRGGCGGYESEGDGDGVGEGGGEGDFEDLPFGDLSYVTSCS